MSSYCEDYDCPRCGGTFFEFGDNKDPLGNMAYCQDCGYGYQTVIVQMTLGEVNAERESFDYPEEIKPLKKLKKPTWSKAAEKEYQESIHIVNKNERSQNVSIVKGKR